MQMKNYIPESSLITKYISWRRLSYKRREHPEYDLGVSPSHPKVFPEDLAMQIVKEGGDFDKSPDPYMG